MELFSDRPSVELLQWLARGSLKQNLLRAIRLWVLLRALYGDAKDNILLSDSFTFAEWRDAFFSPTHPKGEAVPTLHDPCCACAKTCADWLFDSQAGVSEIKWRQSLQQHDAIADSTLSELLQGRLFAVTRRSLHTDLQILTELGWFERQGLYYRRVDNLPARPVNNTLETTNARISAYTLNFLHPDLENIANNFSQQINGIQRFFLQVDIVIPPSKIDRVDDWQHNLRHLWEQSPVPPVKLKYNSARLGKSVECVVYPVCIYYVRRAFYLCAFGQPEGQGEWYNYRLDRIQQMTSLEWTNPSIPRSLFERYQKAKLPTPDYIEVQMANAWGFDFYLPAKLMLLRFDRQFHDRYIQRTFRHDTFEPVSYQNCQKLIRQHIREAQQQQTLVKVLQSRSPHDAYYKVQYRDGDRDVGLRLRAWRPFCEVLLPWELRQSMTSEVQAEAQLYLK